MASTTPEPAPTAPFDRERAKVLGSAEAAAFIGLSLPHFRRLYRLGKVPKKLEGGPAPDLEGQNVLAIWERHR